MTKGIHQQPMKEGSEGGIGLSVEESNHYKMKRGRVTKVIL